VDCHVVIVLFALGFGGANVRARNGSGLKNPCSSKTDLFLAIQALELHSLCLPAATRIKIFFRKQEGDPPKLLSPMDTYDNASLQTLRFTLECLNVFKHLGPFQFWDVEECCRIDNDFEALNSI